MSRAEFSKRTQRDAYDRSNGHCEAAGVLYGLPTGKRCNMPLNNGVEYDHVILDANSKDNSLNNCAAVCPACHRFKTTKRDIPTAAKTLRQQDTDRGISSKSRGFYKPPGMKYDWSTGRYVKEDR